MKTLVLPDLALPIDGSIPLSKKEQIIRYYEKAGRDYQTWSPKYNMHFGYFEKGMNPFRREPMLEKLNQRLLEKTGIGALPSASAADFGCGLGATLRFGARNYPNVHFSGITLVPWQAEQATRLNATEHDRVNSRIQVLTGDYCRTPYLSNSLDVITAIESSCYATGSSKSDLLSEAHRVLKPGGRLVISDGFIKKSIPSRGLLATAYHTLCNSWALSELGNIHDLKNATERLGFVDILIEEISLHVAPSVAHVPVTVIGFLIRQLLTGKERMSKERWDNLKSPLLTMILGSARSHFGYSIVSASKKKI